MSTLSFTRAGYNKPAVHIGGKSVAISQNDRNSVALASNCLSRALTATTDTALDYNLAEAYRLIRSVVAARKAR